MGDPLRIASMSNGGLCKVFLFEKNLEREFQLNGSELEERAQPAPSPVTSNFARVSRQNILVTSSQTQNNLLLRDATSKKDISKHKGTRETPYGKKSTKFTSQAPLSHPSKPSYPQL